MIRSMHIVAAEARDTAAVHQAVHVIVRLHPVLLCRSLRVVRKRGFAEMVLFEGPEILQLETHVEADGPVIVLTGKGILERFPLRVALHADIVRRNGSQLEG